MPPFWYQKPRPHNVMHFRGGDWVQRELVDKLRDFCKKHDVQIVGISSWFTTCKGSADWKEIADFMDLPIIDKSYNTGWSRDIGAKKWIEDNAPNAKYCFLDDARHLFEDRYHPLLVKTSGRYGMDDDDLRICEKILTQPYTFDYWDDIMVIPTEKEYPSEFKRETF